MLVTLKMGRLGPSSYHAVSSCAEILKMSQATLNSVYCNTSTSCNGMGTIIWEWTWATCSSHQCPTSLRQHRHVLMQHLFPTPLPAPLSNTGHTASPTPQSVAGSIGNTTDDNYTDGVGLRNSSPVWLLPIVLRFYFCEAVANARHGYT